MNALNLKLVVSMVGLTLAFATVPAWAQSPAPPHHPQTAAPGSAPDGGPMPMMDMCRQMMGGPMAGMGGDQRMDPKMMAHMLEMRGEMMRAMGDVMMKHGKMMQGSPTK